MRRGPSIVLIALIAALCAMSGVSAGSRRLPGQDAQTFRIDARLVRVSVVVHDNRGRPVPGLTSADFQVIEDGHEQKVSLFVVEDSGRSAARVSTACRRH